jgi:tetratricopeptide (TPR) repeat protein
VSAVNLFTELRDKHPDDYDFSKDQLNWLGVELRDTGMFDEAIAIYKWIIELHPDWWNAYNGIADVYRIRGDKELAIKYYAKSLEMNPEMWYAKQVSEVMKELTEQDD